MMNREQLTANRMLMIDLNPHLNENQISNSIIISSIIKLRNEINRIESVTGPSIRTTKMRGQIAKMEKMLAYSKNLSDIYDQHLV